MSLEETTHKMEDLLSSITKDLSKAERGNKAAAQRVRANTIRLEKVAKDYRKKSMGVEKEIAKK